VPEYAEIKRAARERLGGSLAWAGFREYRLLERLLDADEEIEAMVLTRLRGGGMIGSQRLIVATPRRLLLVEKGLLSGRERVEEFAWSRLRAVSVDPPSRLTLQLDGQRREFTFAQPPRQLGVLADLARARIDPERASSVSTDELLDLARRQLGRLFGAGMDSHVLALAGALAPDEQPLALAFAGEPNGLLVATTRRLLFVPSSGLAGVGEVVSLEYAWLRRVELAEPLTVVVDAEGREVRWDGVVPEERALTLVEVASARLGRL